MKKLVFISFMLMLSTAVFAQTYTKTSKNEIEKKQPHKIIFQLSTSDTLSHKALTKQLGNILSVAPDTKIEVVCHGPGLNVLATDKSTISEKVKYFIAKGVVFNACEFSMKERNMDKSQILPEATYVPAGIIEIVNKQEQGWSYIKAGF